MANLNLGYKMWPLQEWRNRQLLIKCPNLIPDIASCKMRRYGSLINIRPSYLKKGARTTTQEDVLEGPEKHIYFCLLP